MAARPPACLSVCLAKFAHSASPSLPLSFPPQSYQRPRLPLTLRRLSSRLARAARARARTMKAVPRKRDFLYLDRSFVDKSVLKLLNALAPGCLPHREDVTDARARKTG